MQTGALDDLISILNIDLGGPSRDWDFQKTVGLLRDMELARFSVRFSGGSSHQQRTIYSLLSREELTAYVKKMGDDIPDEVINLGKIRDGQIFFSPGDEKEINFPEDAEVYGYHLLHRLEIFRLQIQEFVDKINNGYMDIPLLNKHLWDQYSWAEFRPTKNSLKPTLTIIRGEVFPNLDRAVFDKYIYPRIFCGQGQDLAKIRKCRNCGSYFLGKRLSATFCSDKCRGAFHHANA